MKRYKHIYPLPIFSSQTGSPNIYIYFLLGLSVQLFVSMEYLDSQKCYPFLTELPILSLKALITKLCLWVFDRERERPTKNQSMETLRLAEILAWLWMQKLDLITRLSPWKQPSQKALFHQLSFASTCLTPLMGLGLSKWQGWFCS